MCGVGRPSTVSMSVMSIVRLGRTNHTDVYIVRRSLDVCVV